MKKALYLLFLCIALIGCSVKGEQPKQLSQEDIKVYSDALGDDPLGGEIILNGIKYTLPQTPSALLENGFSFTESNMEEETLEENTYTSSPVNLDNGNHNIENQIAITMYNDGDNTVTLKEAKISEIIVENLVGNQKNTIVLPLGITLDSTYQDIISAYGEPDLNYLTKDNWISYKEKDVSIYGRKLEFHFNEDCTSITKIILKNAI